MKTRLLAFLLCFVLVLSACLMTACGGSKESDKVVEVTDDEARQTALSSFFKGVDAIRKGGVTFTGSLKGSVTDDEETVAIDLSLSLNYNDEKFVAVAEGTAGGETGKGEIYFDGSLLGMLGKEGDDEEDFDVFFLDDVAENVPVISLPSGEDAEYTEILDKVAALIDYDKVAENIAKATKDFIIVETKGKTYVISVSSDKLFDAVLGILDTVKNAGDKKISQLIDDLCGEGTYANFIAKLDEHHGTDKVGDLIPELETLLSDAGIKVDALYAFVGEMMGLTEAEGVTVAEQVKTILKSYLDEMTINDLIAYLGVESFGGMGEVEPLEMAGPAGYAENDEDAMTYEDLVLMIKQFAEMKVNEIGAMVVNPEFDIAAEITPAIEYVTAFKDAIKFNLSVTCDNKLNPTAINLTASVDTTKLPEDLDIGEANLTLTINAEVKDNVTVTPSEAMAAKVADAKAKREAAPEQE